MPDRPLKLRVLRQILQRYGVWEDTGRGKGSHTMFFRRIGASVFSYPVPTHGNEVKQPYVRAIRKKFHLTADHGVPDEDFYR